LLHEVREGGFLPRRVAASYPSRRVHEQGHALDIREDDEFDEAQIAAWVKQASLLPGQRM
jgi:hypothetical protein